MLRVTLAIGVALLVSAAPSRLSAQTMSWDDAGTQNVVSVDSGQLHYRQSKALADDRTGWWEYAVALSDIDCLRFTRDKSGEVLSVVGNANDAVLKKADPKGTTHGYEESLRHVEIDFPPEASAIADSVVRTITNAGPELAKRTNKGACAPL